MTQRIHPGICLLLYLPLAIPAFTSAAPPRNVNEFALAYRVQVYETFRDNRSEYNRRIEAGKQAMVRYRMAENSLDRNRVIDWYSQAILASYPGSAGELPNLPNDNIANTFQDADAIANRGSEFKYNPEFHPLRFNQYSRSPDWETQKPTMPDFDEDANPPSQSLADSSDNTEDSDDSLESETTNQPDDDQLAMGNPSPDGLKFESTTESDPDESVEAAIPDNETLDIRLDDPVASDDEMLPLDSSDQENVESVASLDSSVRDVPEDLPIRDGKDVDVQSLHLNTDSNDEPNEFAAATPDAASGNMTDVPAEVDESNAAEAFETPVSSEVPQETIASISPIEINARVAGHNLALAGLEKRTERAFAGNYKDIVNIVERMEQLFDAHIKARLMIDSAPELEAELITLDNIVHLTAEVNRQLGQFLHSKTEDMDRDTLESLRLRADAVYQAAEEL